MLTNLIAILLKAKAGAISGIFLLGATGALISVSASNGVTTITITEASPIPSASASARPSASVRPLASPTGSARASAKPSASAKANCSAEAKAIALQVQRVNSAYSGYHTALEKLRKDHDKDAIQASDKVLKEIRKSAVKAIHATKTCKGDHDEDKDDEKDEDSATTSTDDNDEDKDEDEDRDQEKKEKKTTSGLAFSGTASTIADQAIAAMKVAFDAAAASPASSHKPEAKKSEAAKQPEGTKRPEGTRPAKPTQAVRR